MTTEEAQKVLDEMQGVRPEKLNGEGKRLFEAVMSIADERDKLKEENKELKIQRDYYKARYLEFNDAFINFKKEDKQ